MKTLIPAYGRDYETAALAKADLLAGKDFILIDYSSKWDGKPINKEDCEGERVQIRYFNDQRSVIIQL